MAATDLTNLSALRNWVGVPENTTTSDALLKRLGSAASQFVYSYINRPSLLSRVFTERASGGNQTRIYLRNWPATQVTALSIDGIVVPASPTPGPGVSSPLGYLLEPWDGMPPGRPQALDVFNYRYNVGAQNIVTTYRAGYLIAAEAQTIPATPFTLSVDAPDGPWAADVAVTWADGTPLTLVTTTPTAGQYQTVQDSPGGYQFAEADAGKAVLISYSYIPNDLFQAVTEIAGERYAYKGRIGLSSKSLGGQETTAFSLKDLSDTVKLVLQPYRRVAF